ncbi:hypothetical protein [Cardiobacterium hominis]|jgi:hypothetical protein|uniref:hypothetical protein n=1 Tax=Cardiobacterium hominis TaxID=2718 RepID=UPI0028ED515E|nr:hypothetical protein [Cardiobacterium hominis]
MGIKQKFVQISEKVWTFFLGLNDKQREKISSLFDRMAIGSLLPIPFRLMSDGKDGDGVAIFVWLLCAIIFAVMSVVALATKE